ncbi:hypothetical protein C8R46DRAFT_1235917 [Mycena filopes]|nr:hypothetical protein C8R46DRAFT_1235917 [Mycena filopes]
MSTSKTSSPSLVLILCFFAFILGQVFNAFCARLSSPAQIVEKVVVVHVGYSFKTLVAVVLLAIITNNLAFVVGYRYLTRSPKIAQRCQTAHSVDRLDIPRHDSLFLLPRAIPIPGVFKLFVRLAMLGTFKILYWPLFTAYPKTTIPLLNHPDPAALALVLTTKLHTFAVCIPDGLPTFIRVFRHLAVKSYRFEGRVFRGRIRFPINIQEVKERTLKSINEEGYQEDKVERRPSRASFLQHLAAAALLRKCQFQVEEEACYATVVEIDEEEDDKRLHEEEQVEPADEDKDLRDEHLKLDKNHKDDELVIEENNEQLKNEREIADAEAGVKNDQHVKVDKDMDRVTATDATYVDAMASSAEEEIDQEEEETFFDAVSGLEGGEEMKIPDEKDETYAATRSWSPNDDDLPSYEEFAMGVPSDILFVKKNVDLIHAYLYWGFVDARSLIPAPTLIYPSIACIFPSFYDFGLFLFGRMQPMAQNNVQHKRSITKSNFIHCWLFVL